MADVTRCSVDGCAAEVDSRGWCYDHWRRWKRTGDVNASSPIVKRPRASVRERFEAMYEPAADGCWVWTGATYREGYGRFSVRGEIVIAHRWSYEQAVGPIPPGMELDHLCRNRPCVNPGHLEVVTKRENAHRGESFAGVNARKTECLRGHRFEGDNYYVRASDGARVCRVCNRLRAQWRRAAAR